ncbi:MAG: class I tRNA ligase family protein, partial [Methanosarcinales archaeon]|nr:class I tRNA ligase family protein [Methanosarcinales archaeon]
SVLMHGFTLDEKGRKMSKSIGNVVAPGEVIETFGADALRMFVLSSSAPWEDLKFSTTEMGTIHRSLNILWNVYRFPLPYMELDKFDPTARSIDSLPLRVEDKWILSRAYSLASDVKKAMEGYELHKVGRAIIHFVLEDLSRWYIQLVRPRTWVESDDPDKLAAYHTLYEVFVTLSKVMAPFMPYMAEDMYQNLVKGVNPEALDSIHMCDYPEGDGSGWIDTGLEEQMELIRRIVEASANARQKVKRKLRWPVSRIVIAPAAVDAGSDANSAAKAAQISEAVVSLESILKDQTNAKNIIVLDAGTSWDELGVTLTPNGAAIGPAFKKDAGAVTKALMAADATAVHRGILDAGTFALDTKTDVGTVQVTGEMVQFNEVVPEGCASSEFTGGVVYVDATLSREIESEGYSREFIRRIQDMRKELDLDVEDSIEAIVQLGDERVIDLVLDFEGTVASEVRSGLLVIGLDVEPKGTLVKEWDIEGVKVNIGISKMEKR